MAGYMGAGKCISSLASAADAQCAVLTGVTSTGPFQCSGVTAVHPAASGIPAYADVNYAWLNSSGVATQRAASMVMQPCEGIPSPAELGAAFGFTFVGILTAYLTAKGCGLILSMLR